jgi:hypothetical protein
MARKRRRRTVHREERVKPPPEAAQHRRPWPMQTLLAAGPEGGGIDSDEFEAALQIVETFHVLTHGLGVVGLSGGLEKIVANYSGSMSDRDAERCAVWFAWAMLLPVGLPTRLVAWIEDDQSIGSVEVLRRATRLWDKVRSDRARPRSFGIDRPPPDVLPMHVEIIYGQKAIASRGNGPTGHHLPTSMMTTPTHHAIASGGQMRASPPSPRGSNATASAVAPRAMASNATTAAGPAPSAVRGHSAQFKGTRLR